MRTDKSVFGNEKVIHYIRMNDHGIARIHNHGKVASFHQVTVASTKRLNSIIQRADHFEVNIEVYPDIYAYL
jgi:hypothetical protein